LAQEQTGSNFWSVLLAMLLTMVGAFCVLSRLSLAADTCETDDTSMLVARNVERGPNLLSESSARHHAGTEVFVMLPLDLFDEAFHLKNPEQLKRWFAQLAKAKVTGLMVDCWWGLTEPAPGQYDFTGYRELVHLVKEFGFKLQVVTSFHAQGSSIPLPSWLLSTRNVWYKDADGSETFAYISLWADHVEIHGRTPVEMYRDWMRHFRVFFARELGVTITEMMIGLGTDGELKYPSYENGPWQYPGIGEFQCFDVHALESLKESAKKAGRPPDWGQPPPPSDTGNYNSTWNSTRFFTDGYKTPRGRFFLDWYAESLERHAKTVLRAARGVFRHAVDLSAKVAGVHWMYKTPSHAAELTAGYYNANSNQPYFRLARLFKSFDVYFDFTCMEMTDASQPTDAYSGPQELVFQVITATHTAKALLTGENALDVTDMAGYNQMLVSKPALKSLTYLRLGSEMMQKANFKLFEAFTKFMQAKGFTTPFSLTQ